MPAWQWISTRAEASSSSARVTNRAAADHRRGCWRRPVSHIGAWATWARPKSARSTARSWDSNVSAPARQFTTCVTPSAGSLTMVVAVGTAPMAMRSSAIHVSQVAAWFGPYSRVLYRWIRARQPAGTRVAGAMTPDIALILRGSRALTMAADSTMYDGKRPNLARERRTSCIGFRRPAQDAGPGPRQH